MDFGVIYIQNKAASRAAMWLGFFVFVLFIFIPLLSAFLFIPLYFAVIIMALLVGFKSDNILFALLSPLASFLIVGLLSLCFWWAVPTIVNAVDELIILFRPDKLTFNVERIPDNECFAYFIAVLGGLGGSFLSVISIGLLSEDLSTHSKKEKLREKYRHKNYYGLGKELTDKFYHEISDINDNYKNGRISTQDANALIEDRFMSWIKKTHNIKGSEAEHLWLNYKWLMEVSPSIKSNIN